ncbi:carbohydrate-binding domain-containing protein [Treponema sp.]|uniref:carbohydrate-binding domain-containing protein n=1 Tax=Treponema sp. TaxID=166 RepID=UPI0025FAFF42|nr:carbohydrate-binding domain-containing protein [Treponema sp.]MCR5218395.1 carbohydrate-binding domain-containing protein [Treponema sp.]
MKRYLLKKSVLGVIAVAMGLMIACSSGYDDGSSNSTNYGNSSGSSGSSSSGLSAGTTTSYDSTATVDTATYSNVLYLNLSDGTISDDNSTWQTLSTSAIKFFEDTDASTVVKVKYTEDDSGDSTGLIKVNATSFSGELAIYISGTMTSGGVKVQSNALDDIAIYLNDATITSSNYPCLEVTKGSAAKVYLSGTNTFADGRAYGTGYGEEYSTSSSATYYDEDSASYVSCTVVKAYVSEGSDSKGTLFCKGDLTIDGDGSLSVTQAYKSCIASKATLTIENGTYTLTSTGKHGLAGDTSVVINDGDITFSGTGAISSSECRKATGIQTDTDASTSSVYINGGSLDITTYNGKGINSSNVYITGGEAEYNVTGVTNYTSDNNKTASYYDADGVYYSNTSVTFAPEGIEAAYVMTVSGGTTEVTAYDDAFNISESSGKFTMTNGYLYAYTPYGDGIDCNGSIYVKGGYIVAYAPTGSEDALDCGDSDKIYVTGGYIGGVCGSSNGASSLSTSGQKVLYFTGSSSNSNMGGPNSSSSSSSSFSKVAVYVSDSCVYAFTLPSSSFGMCMISCPSFTSSSSGDYTCNTSPTFSGGSNFNGLYTSLPTVSTGSTTRTASIK